MSEVPSPYDHAMTHQNAHRRPSGYRIRIGVISRADFFAYQTIPELDDLGLANVFGRRARMRYVGMSIGTRNTQRVLHDGSGYGR